MTSVVGDGKRATSVPASKRIQTTSRYAGNAGAVDEDQFYAAFESVDKVEFYSVKELAVLLQAIRETLGDVNADWEKRIDALRRLRGILLNGGHQYDEFQNELKLLEAPMQQAIKDLRSQVAREACITLAYMSEQMGAQMGKFAEQTFQALISLLPNSAKVMASSGLVACRVLLKNSRTPKLIQIITGNLTSKSREIRRACCEFIAQILQTWEFAVLERNLPTLQDALKQGLNDADAESRAASRKAYATFAEKFKEQAEVIFLSLDNAKQRQLRGELTGSGSNQNIAGLKSSQESLRLPVGVTPGRSTSDIDAGAARRALQRHGVGQRPRVHHQSVSANASGTNNSLPTASRPMRLAYQLPPGASNGASNGIGQTVVDGRSPRTPNKSISQPGSRSTSPSSRLPLLSNSNRKPMSHRPAAAVNSNGGSRDHSPSRTKSAIGQRYLSQTRDMEMVFADALRQRRLSRGATGQDDLDASETSSICSERSATRNGENWDLRDALAQCASPQLAERKEGLAALQTMFKNHRKFTAAELKRICDILGRLFVDPHNKIISAFLDTLVDFLFGYRTELGDWLYLLLTRLLTKMGGDLLVSIQTKLQRALAVVRESFPFDQQFNVLARYIVDPAQTPSLKVKVAVLTYICELAHRMEAGVFNNTAEHRAAVTKIIQWSAEPKSADVRRASQNVLLALFSLNPAEFTLMLSTFPKNTADTVYNLLQTQYTQGVNSVDSRSRSSASPRCPGDGVDLEDIRKSLRQTSAEIQNYSFSTLEGAAPLGSQDSGIVDLVDANTFHLNKHDNEFTPGRFNSSVSGSGDAENDRQQDLIADILSELSNHNRRHAQRKAVLTSLKYMTRSGTFTLWDEHFKTILLILLETLGDNEAEVRSLALRVLREISLCQPARFRDYVELTILKLLEAHKDADKDVVRSAEDCAAALAMHLPPMACLHVLNPIVQSQSGPILLAALKMATKVIEQMSPEEIEKILPDFVPGVLKDYENEDSSIRKSAVNCLVAMHLIIGGEKLLPYLQRLSPNKLKLLDLYIKRAQTQSLPPSR